MPRNLTEKCHALIIGVGKRPQDDEAFEITVKDATQISTRLNKDCGFATDNIVSILNQDSTKLNILTKLDDLIDKTANNTADFVVVFFSGHGAKKDNAYFLITNDTTDDLVNAIRGEEFVEKLKAIKSTKLLVLLDCCHAAGVTDTADFKPLLESNSNIAVIASSRHGEYSFLGDNISLFSAALANALHGKSLFNEDKDKTVRLFDLACYLYATVSHANTEQHPQLQVLTNKTANFEIVNFNGGMPDFDEDLPFTTLCEYKSGKTIRLDGDNKYNVEEFGQEFGWLKQKIEITNSTIENSIIGSTVNGNVTIENHFHGVLQENIDNNSNKSTDKTQLKEFKTELKEMINNQGFLCVSDIFVKIEESNFNYDKPTFANLRNQSSEMLTQLAPTNYLVGLKSFIDRIG
jgi:Caspase domain